MCPKKKVRELPCEIEGWPGSSLELGGNVERKEVFAFSVPWQEWEISGLIALYDDQIVISQLLFRASPDHPFPHGGIRSDTLKFPMGRIRADIQRTVLDNVEEWAHRQQQRLDALESEREIVEASLEGIEAEIKRRGRKPYADEELRVIARTYLQIQKERGVQRVAEEMAAQLGQTVSTINKKIRRATQAGFLGPAQQGRGGRMPGARFEIRAR